MLQMQVQAEVERVVAGASSRCDGAAQGVRQPVSGGKAAWRWVLCVL